MAGGVRIDDHKVWVGARGKDSVFPDGPHKTKAESSAEGAGELKSYEDTTEMIRSQQVLSDKKIRSLPRRPLDRN
jgi:hypothetical protein